MQGHPRGQHLIRLQRYIHGQFAIGRAKAIADFFEALHRRRYGGQCLYLVFVELRQVKQIVQALASGKQR